MADEALLDEAGTGDDWWKNDAQAPTGDAYKATISPERATVAQAMVDGHIPVPTGAALRSPAVQQQLQDAAMIDPSFDAVNAPSRVAGRKAFTSGAQGKNITSFNTAIGHLGTLAQRAEDLSNSSFPLWNGIANAFETQTGDARVTNFNVAKQAVVDELERAFKGTGGNVHEIKQWEETLNSSRSPAQLRGAIGQAAELLKSRIGAMQDSYNNAMGTTAQPLPMLNEHASEALAQFQNPDYLTKGYGALGPSPDTPPSSGGGSPPSPTPQGTLSADGSGDIITARDRQLAQDAQKLLDTPGSTRADFNALTQRYGAKPFDTDLDRLLDYRNRGGKQAQILPSPSGHKDASAFGAVANSAIGSAAIAAGDTASFGLLPKLVAASDAVGQRLGGDNRSIGDIYANTLDDAHARIDGVEAAHPVAALGGSVAGFLTGDGIVGALPGIGKLAGKLPTLIRPAVGDAITSGLYGAGSADNLSDVPGAALKDAALGVAGGVLGRGLVKGAANIASPAIGGAVRRLTDAGVTLTPGQVLGGSGGLTGRIVKGIEDRLTGFDGVGDVINATRQGGVRDFNRKAIDDALAPIGEKSVDVGHAGIADMQQKASDAIDRALTPINAPVDATLSADVKAANDAATRTLSDAGASDYDRAIAQHVEPYLRGQSITGDDIKSIKQGLDSEIGNLRTGNSSPQDRKLADALDGVKESFLDFADRADPSATADYANARRSYMLAKRVSDAAAKSKEGVFTPNQFRQAVVKRGFGVTTDSVARGSAPMQQLATDASTVLPSSVNDSGTAGRVALGAALARIGTGGALGGSEGYREGGTAGALTGALVGSALLSRPGAKAFQYLAAGSRPKALMTLGDALRRNAALGGAVGTPLLLTHKGN